MSGTAIVVGASSGIGKAIALQLADAGWRVGITSRKTANLNEIAAQLGDRAAICAVDLDEPETARIALSAFADNLGGVDLWVLNAGTGVMNPNFDWEPERQTIATNVMGFAAMADIAAHHCIARGKGRIIGISSVAKKVGHPQTASYSGSKAFVSLYLDGLRKFLHKAAPQVSVTEVAPGYTATPLMQFKEAFWISSPELAAKQIIAAGLKRKKHAYVPRRWAPVAALLSIIPR